MKQSKIASLFETVTRSVTMGIVFFFVQWWLLEFELNTDVSLWENFRLQVYFTLLGIALDYIYRRVFNYFT